MNIARRSVENKAVGSNSRAPHGAKSASTRSGLSQVIKAPHNTMKPASRAHVSRKICTSNQAAAAISDAVAARKRPALPVAVADTQAVAAPPVKSFDAASSPNALRSSLPAIPTAALSAAMQAVEAVIARVVNTTRVVMPAPLAGRKRHANVVEPERVVQTKVSKYSTAPAGRKEKVPAKPTVPDSGSADSQATVVKQHLPADIKMRKIAKPSRVSSSLRALAGKAAKAAPIASSISVPCTREVDMEIYGADIVHGWEYKAPSTVSSPSAASSSVAEFRLDVAESLRDWDNIDAEDSDDPQMVSEYISDIIKYLRKRELVTMPKPTYMDRQREVTWRMRRELVDWMAQIHYELRLLPEALFLAVNILDRYLSKCLVSPSKLELIGLTAVVLASKYETSSTPNIKKFISKSGDIYTAQEIVATEADILAAIGFDLSHPSPMTFLHRVSKAENSNLYTYAVAMYLMEICLLDDHLIQYPPSKIAAAGIYLGRHMRGSGPWTANLRHYSGYTEEELEPVAARMLDHVLDTPANEYVFRKYQEPRFLHASNFCYHWALSHETHVVSRP
ncbi:G2/mitotic-specific cyclin [Coemansia sp. RSA 2337]|nr:G2/mitotic-specific cyclin [Coemansia sp. S3946]KAJ2075564.1 G2/mitotic-specific cyclin [Coemansia sp. S155-1]KAJ2465383.1 G2/mitotic-specific cyclin [Coemansia sp. RSA 2337]